MRRIDLIAVYNNLFNSFYPIQETLLLPRNESENWINLFGHFNRKIKIWAFGKKSLNGGKMRLSEIKMGLSGIKLGFVA